MHNVLNHELLKSSTKTNLERAEYDGVLVLVGDVRLIEDLRYVGAEHVVAVVVVRYWTVDFFTWKKFNQN